jgi:pimeloyl-ACP methyl ester carboxylesterase
LLLNAGPAFPAVPLDVLEPTAPPLGGSVVVIHGLGASRKVMLTLGQRLAAAGFRVFLFDAPGHGDNTAPFSFSRAQACAAAVIKTLAARGDLDLRRTTLVGHSMGGGIALQIGSRFDVAATVAVAPAPEVLRRGLPANLLVISPQFDVPAIRQMERNLAQLARGRGDSVADFKSRRAFREFTLRGRTHTGTIFDEAATRETAQWAATALGSSLRADYAMPWRGLLGGIAGFFGLCFLFPFVLSAIARAGNIRALPDRAIAITMPTALLYWTASGLLGICLLAFWVPLGWLHLYSGDYLASLLVISSVPLLALLAPHWSNLALPPKNTWWMLIAAPLAFLAFGGWLNWQLAAGWLNAARWARFPFLLLVLAPYCLAEELALGNSFGSNRSRRAARFGCYLLLRFILWLAAAYALFAALTSALLIVFLVVYLALFSIAQRLATGAVRRRTGSALVAAIFSAILGAWFLAAAFPLT